ncbi:hypothetical protein [Variovorax paradoxus]|uniref:hypothetical protein n=1 Tax=Variovorax paradoxus TaxID=34073 RepID=UPI0012BC5C5D|nr:hypothetical protein [Variovorax paradoxus]
MKAFVFGHRESNVHFPVKPFSLKVPREISVRGKASLKSLQRLVHWSGNVNGLSPRATGISP